MTDINQPISVLSVFDSKKKQITINKLKWNNRLYIIQKINQQYTKMYAATLHHYFLVTDGKASLHLDFNTATLTWRLLEIM